MTPEEIKNHKLEIRQKHEQQARIGVDLVFHAAAFTLIGEELEDDTEAHRLTLEYMIDELLDHGFDLERNDQSKWTVVRTALR